MRSRSTVSTARKLDGRRGKRVAKSPPYMFVHGELFAQRVEVETTAKHIFLFALVTRDIHTHIREDGQIIDDIYIYYVSESRSALYAIKIRGKMREI